MQPDLLITLCSGRLLVAARNKHLAFDIFMKLDVILLVRYKNFTISLNGMLETAYLHNFFISLSQILIP
jgi:hypothetical protein